jgi:hypothetical protein
LENTPSSRGYHKIPFFAMLRCGMWVANSFDIDLEEALNIALEKYKKRLKKGSAGSEND